MTDTKVDNQAAQEAQQKAQAEAAEKSAAAAEKAAKANEKKAEAAKASASAVAKAKKHTGKPIKVRPTNPYKMHIPTQNVDVRPDTITEVTDDKWVRSQLNAGVLEIV